MEHQFTEIKKVFIALEFEQKLVSRNTRVFLYYSHERVKIVEIPVWTLDTSPEQEPLIFPLKEMPSGYNPRILLTLDM